MADPKYANLPGIAHDQPDIYESLPDDDEKVDDEMHWDKPDPVETLHISANEAFGKFRGKHLDATNVDFSDKIRKTKKKGYIAWSGEFELVQDGSEKESPLQKYQRLNCEVRELLDDIEVLTQDKDVDSGEASIGHLVGIARQTTALQDELSALKLEETLGSELLKSLDDPRGSAKEKLLLQLEGLKNLSGGKRPTSSGEDGSASVLYELLMKPETSKMEEQRRLADLERRLEMIEKAVGATPDKMSALSLETNQKSVFGAIQVLGSRLSLLDPSHLDHIEGRLAALYQKMNAIAEKKQVIEDAKKQNKIFELYDLVHQSESMAAALPEVVDRLEALQGLHDQAFQFSKALTQLDSVQQKLEISLSNNQKMLGETQNKFSENVERIQRNFDTIDQRLTVIKK